MTHITLPPSVTLSDGYYTLTGKDGNETTYRVWVVVRNGKTRVLLTDPDITPDPDTQYTGKGVQG